jgi:hypothetical protein
MLYLKHFACFYLKYLIVVISSIYLKHFITVISYITYLLKALYHHFIT